MWKQHLSRTHHSEMRLCLPWQMLRSFTFISFCFLHNDAMSVFLSSLAVCTHPLMRANRKFGCAVKRTCTTCSLFLQTLVHATCSLKKNESWSFGQIWQHFLLPRNQPKPHILFLPSQGWDGSEQNRQACLNHYYYFFWERKMHSWHTTRHGGGPWIDRCTGNKEGVYAKWTMVKYGKEQDARRQLIKCGSWEARKRKYTATSRGCKYCEIEADDDTRWCIIQEESRTEARVTTKRLAGTAWCEMMVANDSQSSGFTPQHFENLKKFTATNIHFHHYVPGCQRTLRSLHFFYSFQSLTFSWCLIHTLYIYL